MLFGGEGGKGERGFVEALGLCQGGGQSKEEGYRALMIKGTDLVVNFREESLPCIITREEGTWFILVARGNLFSYLEAFLKANLEV